MLIAIDHGNKQIKTVNCPPFTSGLRESTTQPLGDTVILYEGKYYSLMDERIPYRRDKTEDERFFLLSLFAIAREVEKSGNYSPNAVLPIQLAVGLPPAHYGAQYERFERYFKGRGAVSFTYNGRPFTILINNVLCFPQAYAAACTMLQRLCDEPRAVVVDIGGFTADYLQIKFGEAQLSACDSLENGVILLYNRILSKVNAEFDLRLEESDIGRQACSPYPDPHAGGSAQPAWRAIRELQISPGQQMLARGCFFRKALLKKAYCVRIGQVQRIKELILC